MEKDELLTKRIQELARTAENRGFVTFTDFLDLNEQNILNQTLQKFSFIRGETFGGYEGAERQMAAFLPDPYYDEMQIDWPIACIRIVPANARFAEKLTHRDILGALMSLGIERSRMGDIAVGDQESYLFCGSQLSAVICDELTQIRHTNVRCTCCNLTDFTYAPKTQTVHGSVASVRLDSVMALAFGSSRSSLLSLIEGGRVFVNGRLITTNAYALKEGDIVSVRGLGKFRYTGVTGDTRKGRHMAALEKYI